MTPGGVWSELGLQTDKIKNLHSWQRGRSRAEVERERMSGAYLPQDLRLGLLGVGGVLVKERLCLRVQPAWQGLVHCGFISC